VKQDNHAQTRKLTDRTGLVTLAVIFILSVSLSNALLKGLRIDLTENQLYTLSDGTINILGSLEEPVSLSLFYSATAVGDDQLLRGYASRVEEMLREFEERANGNIRVQLIDPVAFSEAEDDAQAKGLEAIYLNSPDPVYFGLAGSNATDGEAVISFLDLSRETFLEYDLARLVYSLSRQEKPLLGLLSSLPVRGAYDPATGQPTPPWAVISQIETLFEIRELTTDAVSSALSLDTEINTLVLIHPKNLSDVAQYAIEQFVFAGGQLLVFVDPFAEADNAAYDPTAANRASTLPLLEQWGVKFKNNLFVVDDEYALTVGGNNQPETRHLALLGIDQRGLSQSDVVSSDIDTINLGFSGYIETTSNTDMTLQPLLHTSETAATLTTAQIFQMNSPEQLRSVYEPAGKELVLAARLSGRPESAFQALNNTHIKRPMQPINAVVIADTDILTDRYWVQRQNYFDQSVLTPFAGNADFIINILDNLSGSNDLIGMRGRASYSRPFTKVSELRRAAEQEFRFKSQELEDELAETEERLSELQTARDDFASDSLNADQEAEIQRFIDERLRIRKELRSVQHNLDKGIRDLGTVLKAVNIGLMPILIGILGIFLALRRQRTYR
jgi:ABC-type uncharacterized transport system involved in gliding motility auxiliary subunit